MDQRGPDECWPWTAYRKPSGYGQFRLSKGRFLTASRIAVGLTIGRPVEANEDARLTADLVLAIRAEGFIWGNDQRWAKRLGVSSNSIRAARLGHHWKHLNEQAAS